MEKEILNMEDLDVNSSDVLPAAVTDIGCEREINEDRYIGYKVNGGFLWIVCDGMGGAVGGELAAQLALDTIKRALDDHDDEVNIDILVQAIQEANRVIVLRRQNPAFSGMGTTIVAALVTEHGVYVAHSGDSRAYVVSKNRIEQLMVDHTYVQDLVEKGMISQEEALHHPQSHVLTRCLGAEPRARIDKNIFGLNSENINEQEYLMLCSDGLYSLVSEEEMNEIIVKSSPQDACMALVEMARERGGFDNITIVIVPLKGVLSKDIELESLPKIKPAPKISRTKNKRSASKKSLSKSQIALLIAIISFISLVLTVIAFFSFLG